METFKDTITQKLIQVAFEQRLFEISQMLEKVSPLCFIGYCWGVEAEVSLIHQLEKHLKLVGVRTLIDHRDGQGSIMSHVLRIESSETDYVLYGMSSTLIKKLKKKEKSNGVKLEIPRVIKRSHENPGTVIPLLLDGEKTSSIPPELRDIAYVDFRNRVSYYFSFFELLKRILPQQDLTNFIKEFESLYKAITRSSVELQSQKWELIQKLEQEDENLTRAILDETAEILLTQTLQRVKERKQRLMVQTSLIKSFFTLKIALKARTYIILGAIFLSLLGLLLWVNPKENIAQDYLHKKFINLQAWNLPFPNLYFTGREDESKTIASQFDLYDQKGSAVAIVTCSGLGGVGKTEIAKNYLLNWKKYSKKEYSFKAWFNAEKLDKLLDDYIAFGKELGIITDENSPEEVIEKIRNWFEEHPDWLIVYDNAENIDALKNFFPRKGGHILITSRHTYWPNIIEVTNMSQRDAVMLVNTILRREGNVSDIKLLVDTLGRLPLTIAQASSYILRTKTTIKNYLEKYAKEQKRLFAENILFSDLHNNSVLTTWNINLRAIKKESELAYKLINYLVYLYPDDIPCKYLTRLFFEDSVNPIYTSMVNEAIQILASYSIIMPNKNKGSLSIHRLVQVVIWHGQLAEKNQRKWISKVLDILVNDKDDQLILGGVATERSTLKDIIQYYEQMPIEEKNPLLYQSLGCCYLVDNNFAKAEESFLKGINMGGNSSIHCEYGQALYLQGRYRDAIKQLKHSIEKDDDAFFSYFSEMEKLTVVNTIRAEIDKIGTVRIKSSYLAYYLLLKCYLELKEKDNFDECLRTFKKLIGSQKDTLLLRLLNEVESLSAEI